MIFFDATFLSFHEKKGSKKTRILAYFSLSLKSFVKWKKILTMASLFVNNQLYIEFRGKASHFNKSFPTECSLMSSSSISPNYQRPITTPSSSSFDKKVSNILESHAQLIKNYRPTSLFSVCGKFLSI